jgi:MHS family shikimate/dehydroshikimate transporter-like MFS transporter
LLGVSSALDAKQQGGIIMSSPAEVASTRKASILTIALISLSGSTIEWYDFFIYGTAAALVFPKLFFPETDPLTGVLLSFSTFAVGFLARPVGGIIFGAVGDRIGRKRTLAIALIVMGLGTTLVGLMPTYATLGVAASIILTVLRFVQGLAVGGQWGGAVLIATENSPRNRRGFYGSFAQLGVPVAVILSNVLFLILESTLSTGQFASWGWRIPFLLSVILIFVGLYVQVRLEETMAFAEVQRTRTTVRAPLLDVIVTYPKQIILAAGAFVCINGTFYILITYIISYGKLIGVPSDTMLYGVLISAVFSFFAIMGFAALSDIWGRKGLYIAGAALLGLWGFPLFWLVNTKSTILIWLALLVGQIFLSAMYGPQAAFYSELFGTRVRYSGASLGYQIGAVFGGGLATIISAALYEATKTSLSISIYIALLAAISLISVLFLTETYQRDVTEMQAEERRILEQERERGEVIS